MAGDSPMISTPSSGAERAVSCSFKATTSVRVWRRRIAEEMVARSFSVSQGLGIKSIAPARIAFTAFSVSAYAVINNTTACGSFCKIFSSHRKPSCPLLASRLKFMSSKIMSGLKLSIKYSIRAGEVVTFIFST